MSSTRPVNSGVRQEMFDKFQPWVLSTYGDSAKTKTITLKKAIRIQALLRSGDKNDSGSSSEPSGSDVAKFRLWVKSKGLTLTRPGTEKDPPSVSGVDDDCQEEDTPMLFVPTGTDKNIDGKVQLVYKRVAVVEQFFSIIYNVHVESSSSDTPQLRGRAGKHCGQKRTYRAVADQYAFIPREAISKFLSYCTECQKKQPCITAASLKSPPRLEIKESRQSFDSYPGACAGEVFDSSQVPATPPATPPSDQEKVRSALSPAGSVSSPAEVESGPADPQQLQLEPAEHHHQLQGYNQQQQAGGDQPNYHINQQAAAVHAMAYAQACHAMQSFMSRSLPMPLPQHNYQTPEVERMEICGPEPYRPEPEPSGDRGDGGQSDIDLSLPITSTYLRKMRCGGTDMMQFWSTTPQQDEDMDKTEGSTSSLSMMTTSGSLAPAVSSVSPLSPAVSLGSQVKSQSTLSHLLQQQNGNINMSPSTLREDVSVTDDTSSTGNKDDDDDEDEEDGNDENFDGLNRDPERLKAFNMFVRLFVDENLDRHVPISKQPKEKIQAIIDSCTRQFPEYSERARKRIRTYLKSCRRTKRSREQAGLDINNRPTPPHLTSVLAEQLLARACENEAENAKRMRMGLEPVSQSLPSSLMTSPSMDTMPSPPQLSLTTSAKIDYKSEQLVNLLSAAQNAAAAPPPPPAPAHISLSGSNNSHISGSNGAGLTQSPQFLGVSSVGLLDGMGLANGQNSVEGLKKAPILNHKLNGTEIAAVRQLITGYRESAAFLLRSADELEHLIQIQAKL